MRGTPIVDVHHRARLKQAPWPAILHWENKNADVEYAKIVQWKTLT